MAYCRWYLIAITNSEFCKIHKDTSYFHFISPHIIDNKETHFNRIYHLRQPCDRTSIYSHLLQQRHHLLDEKDWIDLQIFLVDTLEKNNVFHPDKKLFFDFIPSFTGPKINILNISAKILIFLT